MIDLSTLNEAQRRAVIHTQGPLLIVAGAGAGKTKTITYRIAHLVENGTPPESILAITFTNKAAKEMLERTGELLGRRPPRFPGQSGAFPWIGTFHGLGAAILREFGGQIGISTRFTILDSDDTLTIVRRSLKSLGYDPKYAEPRRIRDLISRAKGDGLSQSEYAAGAKGNTAVIAAKVWNLYDAQLRSSNGLDFDDLLLLSVRLLKERKEVRDMLIHRYSYIHVDEYQDTNKLQYELVRLLVGPDEHLCVVGDSDQNIYSWRGANIENILNFEHDFPRATIVTLEENYRSTQTILSAANQVIEKNLMRKPKNLFTSKGAGEPITIHEAMSEIDEAQYIAARAQILMNKGVPGDEIAVLYRTNFQSRAIEEQFLALGVPYTVIGTRFYDRKEVKDLLAYLRLALNPESPLDLMRAVSTPSRGIGGKSVEHILNKDLGALSTAMRKKVDAFMGIISEIGRGITTLSASEATTHALKHSGLLALLESDQDNERIGNLSELVSLAARYDELPNGEGMERFLADVSLASDQDGGDRASGVRVMTIHAAKGLEFDAVFITGLEEDLFPKRRPEESPDRSQREEERRLFYVAITRAKKWLFLSHAAFRTVFGNRQVNVPSSFLADIDDALIAIDTPTIKKEKPKFIFFD